MCTEVFATNLKKIEKLDEFENFLGICFKMSPPKVVCGTIYLEQEAKALPSSHFSIFF